MPAPRLCAVIPVAACGTGTGLYAGGWQLCRISGNVLPAWMGRRNIGNTAEKKRTCRFHSYADRMYVCVSAVLPVYGLSQYGLPLLMYCVLRLGKRTDRRIFGFSVIFMYCFFGCNSSLVLSGFAVLGIWAVWEIVTLVDKRKQFSAGQAAAWGILLLTYIVENGSLLLQLSGGQGERFLTNRNICSARWTFQSVENKPPAGRTAQCGLSWTDPSWCC